MMKQNDLLTQWLTEEQAAHIHGWDFSHIRGRYQEEDNLPWDYGRLVRQYLRNPVFWISTPEAENSSSPWGILTP